MTTEHLLLAIAFLLFLILVELIQIRRRLKDIFPTQKERDYAWAKRDRLEHNDAHQDDK